MKFVEITKDSEPVYISVEKFGDTVGTLTSTPFQAKYLGDIEYQLSFNYNVPTKKVKLSILQIQDIVNFYKIWLKHNPDWKEDGAKLFEIKELE